MRTLISILLFFSTFSANAFSTDHSVADLYKHLQRTFSLTNEGKSLVVISLCDSVIREYKDLPGSGYYLGYIYIYLAKAAMQQGDISLARYSFDQAAGYFQPGSQELAYQIPVNLVALNIEADRIDRGLAEGLQLLSRPDFINDPTRQGTLLNNLATAASEKKNFRLADSLYTCLFKLIKNRPVGVAFDSALTYRNFGLFKLATGSPVAAKIFILHSLDLYESRYGFFHFQTAKSWHDLGKVYKNLNQIDSAAFCFGKARMAFGLNDYIELSDSFLGFRLDYETVFLEFLLDETDLLRTQAFQYIGNQRITRLELALQKSTLTNRRFEGLLRVMISSESGFILADKGRKIFDLGIQILLDLFHETGDKAFLNKALLWSVQAGSLSLQAKAGVELRSFEDDSSRAHVFRLYSLREAIEKNTDPNSRSLRLLEYQSLKEILSSNWPAIKYSSESEKATLKQIAKAIGKSRLLCYHQLDSVLLVFRLTNHDLQVTGIPLNNKLKGDIENFNLWVTHPISGNYLHESVDQYCRLGSRLYEILLKPFIGTGNSKELFIRPDGLIMKFPFEALVMWDSQSGDLRQYWEFRDLPFVVKSTSISYVSNISAIKRPFHFAGRRTMRIVYCPNDQSAPEIKNETRWLSEAFGKANRVRISESAFNVKSAFADTDIIHFAGHVKVNQDDAMQTLLGCSGQSSGSFRLSELLYARLTSDLVFINGCESAQGELNRGDGNLSPGLFFLLAGADGVIEHRWKAPDFSGFILARDFYKSYPGKKPFIALSKAKRNYLATCQPGLDHPHYWAGMVYTGPIQNNSTKTLNLIWLLIIPVVLLVLFGLFLRKG
jgi:hypothetical protein